MIKPAVKINYKILIARGLGTMVNKMSNRSVEVKARLAMANRAYCGLQNHMKSRIISRNTKTLLYKTLIRPVLIYGCYLNKTNIVSVSLSVKSSGEFMAQ